MTDGNKIKSNHFNGGNISIRISNFIGEQFYKLGYLIASHPWNTIIITLLVALTCSVGFIKFHNEKNVLELWVPKEAKFYSNTKWLVENMKIGYRLESVLITAPNVLEPEILRKALMLREEIIQANGILSNGSVVTWSDACIKIPYLGDTGINSNINHQKSDVAEFAKVLSSNLTNDEKFLMMTNPSVYIDPIVYCNVINKIPMGCLEKNILEIWKYDNDVIANLTLKDVLMNLNETTHGPLTGHETNYNEFLSGIVRDSKGYVISANGMLFEWFTHVNFSDVDSDKTGNLAGTADWATEDVVAWEYGFLDKVIQFKKEMEDGNFEIYYSSAKSFGDISSKALFQDMDKLMIAGVLMAIYIQITLSKFSWTELRIYLSTMGLLSIGVAFIASCGICSILGIYFGPVHTALPFLLMGLGVDDMFVIMACWRNLPEKTQSLEDRMGLMLKQAGASITITSLTDVIAFLIGSITVIPSLKSFCLYAAIGILLTYIFVITIFVAVFTLDERRIKHKRNAFLPCIIHKEDKTAICCEPNILQRAFKAIYSKFVLTKPGKIVVILTVIGLTSFSIDGLSKLDQKFDRNWFIPTGTYLYQYIEKMKDYFPETRFEGMMLTGQINYIESFPKLARLVRDIEDRNEYFYKLDSWTKPFFEFVKIHYHKDLNSDIISDYEWRFYLSKFLYSPLGGKYQPNFRFDGELKCGEPTPNVTVALIPFRFRHFTERSQYVPAMHLIEDMIEMKNFTSGEGFSCVWAKSFPNWIIDEIIDKELIRNIGLAMLCVMVCTMIIIPNIQICFWIFICVTLTLINVCGFMYQWGLTIDITTSIALQLAIGLCVDYAAHVGHSFIFQSGDDLTKRSLKTIIHIGSAVFNGGFSTFIALIMLKFSEAYTFQVFFKVFSLVILFGLFHGIVLFPVILSIIGPKSYKSQIQNSDEKNDGEELQPFNKNGIISQKDHSTIEDT